jgi:hypothetical protein
MSKFSKKLENLILNPTKKDLIFMSIGAVLIIILVVFGLWKINQPKKEVKGVETKKITVTPSLKPTMAGKITKIPIPTIKRDVTSTPTTYFAPSSTPTSVPTSTPTPDPTSTSTPQPSNTPTNNPTETPTPTDAQQPIPNLPQ